ncbi:MAG: hypothetical protein K1X81_03345 [Bacteroidia bacterium]|nr:hypothetical protein [Bacteroidia bacterium]
MGNEEKHQMQLELIGRVNRFRGILLQSFIGIEHILGHCVAVIKYNGVYADYYKKFKTAKMVINDFLECYESEKGLLNKYFTSKEDFNADLFELVKIRDIAAHFQWFNTAEAVKKTIAEQTVFFMSYRFGAEAFYGISQESAREFQANCLKFADTLALFQQDLNQKYAIPLYGENPDGMPESGEYIEIVPLVSLKNPIIPPHTKGK